MPSNLSDLKSKVDKLDIAKLETTPVDLSKLSNVVKNDFVEKIEYNELLKKVNDISTTNTSNLVKITDYNTKMGEIENKINAHDYAKYLTSQEFDKLTADTFTTRLKEENSASKNDIANFVKKRDFDEKLLCFKKRINSNKTKHVFVENELNEQSKKLKQDHEKD